MRKLALLIAALVAAVPATADAKPKPRLKIIRTTGSVLGHFAQPASAEGYSIAGFASDARLGQGATTVQGTVDGQATTGAFILYFDKGTIRGGYQLAVTTNADGTSTLSGRLAVDGGTGAYRRARGSGTASGSLDADGYARYDYSLKLKVRR